MKIVWLGVLICGSLWAQPVYVYSEFVTVNAQGKVTVPARPREILSPAIVRNAFASFQVVIEAEASMPWFLHVGLNPEQAVQVTLYRLKANQVLEKVELPVKGQGTQVFWMDLWAEGNAQTGRIKVEPQLNIDNDWVIYPMEVRVQDVVVPKLDPRFMSSPGERAIIRSLVCGGGIAGTGPGGIGAPMTPNHFRYRNGTQDLELAKRSDKAELQTAFGPCNAAEPANPESYYAVRDLLFTHTLH